MTHGFDDQGRQYDADGNLRDWWTADISQELTRSARKVVVDAIRGVSNRCPGMHLNGELTQGENIADIGGVKIAYARFPESARETSGGSAEENRRLHARQRFFLVGRRFGARISAMKTRSCRLNTDPHSPGQFRVNGPLSNMPEFPKGVRCSRRCPMVRPPDKRVNIW